MSFVLKRSFLTGNIYNPRKYIDICLKGIAPECENCIKVLEVKLKERKRPSKLGFLRPNIVLYNETHPKGFLIN